MKRLTLLLLVTCVIALAISGCFRGEKEKSLIVDNVKLVLEDNTVTLFSLSRAYGIELTFSSDISRDSLTAPEQMLMIHKGDGEKTLVALAKIGEEIEEGERLLTIAGISSLEGLLLKAESEILLQDSATPPLPNGICVVDTAIPPSSSGFFYVHGKGLSNVGGIAVTINYDSTYFTVDTTQGNDGVTALGTFSQGLLIVDSSTAGTLKVDAAFMNAKNIADEDMFKVHVTTKTKVGESNVAITGEVRDPNTNLIQTTFTGGKVKIGEECKLLGDFNNDCTVNLQDFIVFAQHYNSVSGDTRYGVLYDMHPAQMGTGAWAGIYCKATPDGQIKLGDFIVFANNYGKQCPTPPTNPTISGYVRKSDNTPIAGVTMTFSGIGTTTTNSNGYYSKQVTSGWSGTVTPSLSSWTFIPTSRSYSNVTGDMSNENYQRDPPCTLPGTPYNPSPGNANTITYVPVTLTWACANATSYDVYFGTSTTPPKVGTVTSASYSPGLLNPGRYYWKIVAKNNCGQTSGPTWYFDVLYVSLSNGNAYGSFPGTTGSQRYFIISNVTAGSLLTVELYGGTGDADLYVRKSSWPSTSSYDWRSYNTGNTEKIEIPNAAGGTYYVMVRSYSSYTGVYIRATWGTQAIIDDNFESYATGNLTSVPWGQVVTSGTSNIQIGSWGNPGKSATFYDPTPEGYATLSKAWTSFKKGTLEFDFRIADTSSFYGVRFYPVFTAPAIYIGDEGSGFGIYAQKADGSRQKMMSISPNTYYSVKLDIDLTAASPYYRVYVNGSYKGQISSVTNTEGIQLLAFNDRICTWLDLDNIKLVNTGTFIAATDQELDSSGIDTESLLKDL